jgi:hypothetical protein
MTGTRFYVDIGIAAGRDADVTVFEDELASITKADLKWLGISRADLDRVFAEAKELMRERGIKPADRIRPIADQMLDGSWFVLLVGYSPKTDPLLNDGGKVPPRGKRN